MASERYATFTTNTVLTLKEGEAIELISGSYAGVDIDAGNGWIAVASFNRFDAAPTGVRTGSGSHFAGPMKVNIGVQALEKVVYGYVTVRFLPGFVDPSKTLLVAPTTNSVTVQLQSSTNLVDWSTAAAVTLTNVPAATFFRARVVE